MLNLSVFTERASDFTERASEIDRSVSNAIARRLDFCDMNFAWFRFSHAEFVAAHAQRARKLLKHFGYQNAFQFEAIRS